MNTNTITVVVGQEVAVRDGNRSSWNYHPRYQFGYVVTKVTPSGQLVIETTHASGTKRERRFKPAGKYSRPGSFKEVGASSSYTEGELILDVAGARAEIARYDAKQSAVLALRSAADAANKLNQAGFGWSKETMLDELAKAEAWMVAARLAVNALAE